MKTVAFIAAILTVAGLLYFPIQIYPLIPFSQFLCSSNLNKAATVCLGFINSDIFYFLEAVTTSFLVGVIIYFVIVKIGFVLSKK